MQGGVIFVTIDKREEMNILWSIGLNYKCTMIDQFSGGLVG
jgi:hypothetical protein